MLGIHGRFADNITFDRVLSQYNNSESFNLAPVSGGVKLGQTRGVTVKDSSFSNNYGHGFWEDMSVYNSVFRGTDFTNNAGNGLFLEISAKVVVGDSMFLGNALDGVKVNNTSNVPDLEQHVRRQRSPHRPGAGLAAQHEQERSGGRSSSSLAGPGDAVAARLGDGVEQRRRSVDQRRQLPAVRRGLQPEGDGRADEGHLRTATSTTGVRPRRRPGWPSGQRAPATQGSTRRSQRSSPRRGRSREARSSPAVRSSLRPGCRLRPWWIRRRPLRWALPSACRLRDRSGRPAR